MAHAKPVVATAYSGNIDFTSEDNSYPVRYELVSVPEGCAPYPTTAVWAEPDRSHAAQLLRHIFERVSVISMDSREGQPTIGFVGAVVLQEKDGRLVGLRLGLAAESAFLGFESFGLGHFANAVRHVGPERHGRIQKEKDPQLTHRSHYN
jgi:hypothetical protein